MNESKEPLLHLQFNELINENERLIVHDETKNKYHATVHGEDLTVMPSDAFGSCLSFDGNDWLELDHRLQYQSPTTIAFWIDPEDIQKEQCFLGKLDPQKETAFWFGCKENKFLIQYGGEKKECKNTPPLIEKWFHLAIVLKEIDGKFHVSVYMDGVLFETVVFNIIIELADGESWKIGHVNTDEQDYFSGNIDDVLFYHSALNVEEIMTVKELAKTAQSTFSNTHPIAFDLISDDVQNALYISNEGNTQPLVLEVTNASANTIVFKRIKEENAVEKGHFELLFRPQTFENKKQKTEEKSWEFINGLVLPEHWIANPARLNPIDQTVTISFYYNGENALEVLPGNTLGFELEYGNADGANGGRGTQIVLNYQQILYKDAKTPFKGMRNKQVDIVNQRGKRNIPLHAGFIGTNTILNFADKETAGENTTSDITIRLFNTLKKGALPFNQTGSKKETRFILSFDAIDDARALCNDDEMKAIGVELSGKWGSVINNEDKMKTIEGVVIKSEGEHTQFVINHLNVNELQKGNYLDLKIKNIRSSKPSGFSNIYIHYENIPGYWDGEFVLPVEKTPIVHKGFNSEKNDEIHSDEKSVGIGMNPDEKYRLSVGGNLKIEADPDHGEVLSIGDKSDEKRYLSISTKELKYEEILIPLKPPVLSIKCDVNITENLSSQGNVTVEKDVVVQGNINTSQKIQENGHDLMPSGAIIMWAKSQITEGWIICDGNNGTPDLRDRFIVGAGSDYRLNDNGGKEHVQLTEEQMPSHSHGYVDTYPKWSKYNINEVDGAADWSHKNIIDWYGTSNVSHTESSKTKGSGQPHENRPPYYALYYIMKL